ncbi:MAG: glycerophosphodiester phosphodiesterase family protein [Clostridiales bacterium]|nr:glycerophosphodiester phosphodiesterase family protein [Clostridiales bacterium]
MIDFNKSIFENRQKQITPFLAAHRGVNGANIPCNTLLAYKIAIDQGADIIEIDVAKSKDGEYFAFHPGMEFAYLKTGKTVAEMSAEDVASTPILNNDEAKTHYRIPTLAETFAFLKDKVYINVDKFQTDIKGITEQIRNAHVEKQVIVKSDPFEEKIREIEKYAPDLMFMPFVKHVDRITDRLRGSVNCIGVEALFDSESDEVAGRRYIDAMHDNELLVWGNSIVYDENAVLSAGMTDDISLERGGEYGWGKLLGLGFDIIQTDWLLAAKQYFNLLLS